MPSVLTRDELAIRCAFTRLLHSCFCRRAGTSMPQRLQQLPDAVVELILQQLPQQDRLCRAALVCRAWAAAAAAATVAITFDSPKPTQEERQQDFMSLKDWLHQHSQQLVSARISGRSQLQLEFAHMQRLQVCKLSYCTLQLPHCAEATATAQTQPFKKLRLRSCTFDSVDISNSCCSSQGCNI